MNQIVSLKKYYLKEFINYIITVVIIVLPFGLSYIFSGLLRKLMIAVGIGGIIVYYNIEKKIIPKVTYNKLGYKQKKIVCWYNLVIYSIFSILTLFVNLNIKLKIIIWVIIIYNVYIFIKKIKEVKRYKNG